MLVLTRSILGNKILFVGVDSRERKRRCEEHFTPKSFTFCKSGLGFVVGLFGMALCVLSVNTFIKLYFRMKDNRLLMSAKQPN